VNDEAIRKVVTQGAIASFVSAGMTSLVVAYAILSDAQGLFKIWNDPLNIFDILLIIACGVGILWYSRTASVVLFVYYVVAKIYASIESGNLNGIFIGVIFLYFFGRAVQGTFKYHRLRRAENASYRAAPKWIYIFGIPIGLVVFAIMGVGLMTAVGVLPSTEVVIGSDMPQKDRDMLVDNEILLPNEQIQMFYSNGFISILEDGNVLTDKRVVSYETIDGKLQIFATSFEKIGEVNVVKNGDYIDPTIIEVWTKDGSGFRVLLSTENGGDKKFISALKEKYSTD